MTLHNSKAWFEEMARRVRGRRAEAVEHEHGWGPWSDRTNYRDRKCKTCGMTQIVTSTMFAPLQDEENDR